MITEHAPNLVDSLASARAFCRLPNSTSLSEKPDFQIGIGSDLHGMLPFAATPLIQLSTRRMG
jgi:hypothetical protein